MTNFTDKDKEFALQCILSFKHGYKRNTTIGVLITEIERLDRELKYVNNAWSEEARTMTDFAEKLISEIRHLQKCNGTCEDSMSKWKCNNEAHRR